MKDYKLWTTHEDNYLRNNYGISSAESLAKDLGRSKCSVFNRAHLLGLQGKKKTGFYRMKDMDSHDIWLMQQLRNEGMNLKEIGEKFDLPIGCVRYLLREEINAA